MKDLNSLLAVALNAATNANATIVTYKDFLRQKDVHPTKKFKKLDMNALHQQYLHDDEQDEDGEEDEDDEENIEDDENEEQDNAELVTRKKAKSMAANKREERISTAKPKKKLRAMNRKRVFAGGGGGYIVPRVRKSPPTIYIPENFRSPEYDYDFTKKTDRGANFQRGPFAYKRPCGWNRLALNVLCKFGNSAWLGVTSKGRKTKTSAVDNEWAVSYHGTVKSNVNLIAQNGFNLSKGKRFKFGKGIYTSPDINVAEKYAAKFKYEDKTYKIVFQVRVNPNTLIIVDEGMGWLSPSEDDVRPYGICIKECDRARACATYKSN